MLCAAENHCVYRRARSEPQAEPAPDSPVRHAVARGLVSETTPASRRGSPRTWDGASGSIGYAATSSARCGKPPAMRWSPPARIPTRWERRCIPISARCACAASTSRCRGTNPRGRSPTAATHQLRAAAASAGAVDGLSAVSGRDAGNAACAVQRCATSAVHAGQWQGAGSV